MPEGGIKSSLTHLVATLMAPLKASVPRARGSRQTPPTGPAGTVPPTIGYSFGNQGLPGGTRDVTVFQQTFQPREGMFSPGYPLVPTQREVPRAWDYPILWNTIYTPRAHELYGFDDLRALAASYDMVRLAIETRKDQIDGLNWSITPVDEEATGGSLDSRIKKLTEFWQYPDGYTDFHLWLRQVLEEVMVVDAPAFEVRQNRAGEVTGFDVIDGATIKILLDETGRRPQPPAPAYEQVIHGRPWVLLEDGNRMETGEGDVVNRFNDGELIYRPRNPRIYKGYGFCFSPDMEILTKFGWKSVSELSFTDLLATRNWQSKAFEWQAPIALTTRQFSGDLVHFTSSELDILVTPEHRMIVRKKWGRNGCHVSDDFLMPACELQGHYEQSPGFTRNHFQIPVTCEGGWQGEAICEVHFGARRARQVRNEQIAELRAKGFGYKKIGKAVGCPWTTVADIVKRRYDYAEDGTNGRAGADVTMSGDDYCAFMGMYLSEGSINKGRIVVITQAQDSAVWDKFRCRLTKIFGPISYEMANFNIYRSHLARHLARFGKSHQKFVPDDIMNASSEQIAIFLEFLFDGDAHRHSAGTTYHYTTSKRLADQIQELAQKIGTRASIRSVPLRSATLKDGRVIQSRRPQYRIAIAGGKEKYLSVRAVASPFTGSVYCVSVPNKSVYIRRNGLAAWTSQSPIEQIVTTIHIGLRRQRKQLQHFTVGNIPVGLINTPEKWSSDQVKEYQKWWDTTLSGNTGNQTKLVWGPAGAKYQEFAPPPLKDDFDEWLARIVSFAFSLPPTWAVHVMNRATAETSQNTALTEGLGPLLNWVKRTIDFCIQKRMGYPDLEFTWSDIQPVDPAIMAKVNDTYVKNGSMTHNEVREQIGLDPIEGGDQAMIITNAGPVLLTDVEQMSANAANPPPPPIHMMPGAAPGDQPPSGNGLQAGRQNGSQPPKSQANGGRGSGRQNGSRRGNGQQGSANGNGNGKQQSGRKVADVSRETLAKGPTLSKDEADYVDHPVRGERCAECSMFRPARRCTLVRGDISPRGHCKHFDAVEEEVEEVAKAGESPFSGKSQPHFLISARDNIEAAVAMFLKNEAVEVADELGSSRPFRGR